MTNEHLWISVDDALPKVNERVLVVCVNRMNHSQRHVSICEYWGNRAALHPRLRWSGNKLVSHWAPLPELPIGILPYSADFGLERAREQMRKYKEKEDVR